MEKTARETGCCISEAFVRMVRKGFRKIGCSIGRYPWAYSGVTAVICCILSAGFLKAELNNNVRDGYTPLNAPSRIEQEAFVNFFKKEPFLSFVQVRANDGGSLLRLDHFASVINLLDYLMEEFKVKTKTGHTLVMSKVCHPFCEENDVIRKFYFALKAKTRARNLSQTQIGAVSKLDYPIASIFNKEFFLGDHFYGVENQNNNSSLDQVTSLKNVSLMVFRFRNTRVNETDREFLKLWDDAVFDFSKNFNNPLITMSVWSVSAASQEILRAGLVAFSFLPPGIAMVVVFAIISVSIGSWLNLGVGLTRGKIWVTLFGVFCPLMATASAYGLTFVIGFKAKSVLMLMPFLVLAIGVDDAFLMIHAWQRTERTKSVPDRMGEVLASIGPGITVTSLTNSIAFAIGAFTPTPAVRLLCAATSIAMAIDFVCELTFFGAILAISGRGELDIQDTNKLPDLVLNCTSTEKSKRSIRKKFKDTLNKVLDKYSNFLNSFPALIAGLLLVASYATFSILGVLKMQVELSVLKLWLKDSPLLPAMAAKHKIMWNDSNDVIILVNRSPDFANSSQSLEFTEMVQSFENMNRSLGRPSTRLWVSDYKEFIKFASYGNVWGDYSSDYEIYYDHVVETDRKVFGEFDSSQLQEFFQIADYQHWNATVHWSFVNGTPTVDRFVFFTSYHNCTTWAVRADILTEMRQIAAQYSQFQVSVWEPDGFFVDQILSMKVVTLTTVAITMCSMAGICFLFIPNFWCVIVASISTASISFGVCGGLSWWNIDLDPITMVSIIMTIGFSVDYTAHVSYHYCQHRTNSVAGEKAESRVETIRSTLEAVGWPMIQAGLSTIIAVFPLSWVGSYMADVFMKTMALGAACGLLHGLFFVPVILLNFPDSGNKLFGFACLYGNQSVLPTTSNLPSVHSSQHSLKIGAHSHNCRQKGHHRRLVSWPNRVSPDHLVPSRLSVTVAAHTLAHTQYYTSG